MSKKINVYWCPWSTLDRQMNQIFLERGPKSVASLLHKDRNPKNTMGAYQTCTAFRETYKNLYYLPQSATTHLEIETNGAFKLSDSAEYYSIRPSSLEGAFSINMDFGWVFFSEESLQMRFTAPHMSKNVSQEYGFLAAGGYDISSWVRPIFLTYQLYPGVQEFKTIKGEPAAYVEFLTDKEVNLVPFVLNEEVIKIIDAAVYSSRTNKWQLFSELYSRFRRLGMPKRLLKEIKQNLIESN
jgi:hypothetical protein